MHELPASNVLAETLGRLLPVDTVWRVGHRDELKEPAHPSEAVAVARAVERRQREFAAGRQCARQALLALCGAADPVLAGPDRAPIWPAGVVGSITHNEHFCAAAVASAHSMAGLGIDLDSTARFDRSLEAALCTRHEIQSWLEGHAEPRRQQRLAMVFAVKEAFYKAQYTLSRAWLGFEDVTIVRFDASPGRDTFTLELDVLTPPRRRDREPIPSDLLDRLMGQGWTAQGALVGPVVLASVVIRP